MLLKRYSGFGVPAASRVFRTASWRAFQLALNPLARARSLPTRRYVRDDTGLAALCLALART
jgi:hypothetical protein